MRALVNNRCRLLVLGDLGKVWALEVSRFPETFGIGKYYRSTLLVDCRYPPLYENISPRTPTVTLVTMKQRVGYSQETKVLVKA